MWSFFLVASLKGIDSMNKMRCLFFNVTLVTGLLPKKWGHEKARILLSSHPIPLQIPSCSGIPKLNGGEHDWRSVQCIQRDSLGFLLSAVSSVIQSFVFTVLKKDSIQALS